MREFILGIAGGFHVGKLVGALLLEVIETTDEAHASLAFHNAVVSDVNRLNGSRTSADWGSDRSGGGHEEHVDPRAHRVDE